ncbi:MAG: hypothetical protein RBR15_04800 [Sphaerochaeta sp.]|nr:hypothetical protein [Sphaerochaeta sp.]
MNKRIVGILFMILFALVFVSCDGGVVAGGGDPVLSPPPWTLGTWE